MPELNANTISSGEFTQAVDDLYAGSRGKHYDKGDGVLQHWDFAEIVGCGYDAGCASKYLDRAGKKTEDPVEDLEKAINYAKKARSYAFLGRGDAAKRMNAACCSFVEMADFVYKDRSNSEAACMKLLLFWTSETDLDRAVSILEEIRKIALGGPTSGYVQQG